MTADEKRTLHLAEAIAASDPLRDDEAVAIARTALIDFSPACWAALRIEARKS